MSINVCTIYIYIYINTKSTYVHIEGSSTFLTIIWQCKTKMSQHHTISRANTGTEAASHFSGHWKGWKCTGAVQAVLVKDPCPWIFPAHQQGRGFKSLLSQLSCSWIPLLCFAPVLSFHLSPSASPLTCRTSLFSALVPVMFPSNSGKRAHLLSGHKSSQLLLRNPWIPFIAFQ